VRLKRDTQADRHESQHCESAPVKLSTDFAQGGEQSHARQEKIRVSPKNTKEENAAKTEPKKSDSVPIKNEASFQPSTQTSKQQGITAARIAQAIDGGEFNLYCQKIIPIKSSVSSSSHYEILIRMHEEENNLMPPGSFLPLVDQFKMMPKLDRWIINLSASLEP
jgi:hypothetical protein